MKRKLLSLPVLIGAVLGYLGIPRLRGARQTSREAIKGQDLAQAYDQVSRLPQFQAIHRMIVRELDQYSPEGTLVDVGSGPGHLLSEIAQVHPFLKLVGVDVSAEMVEAATANARQAGLRQVRFRQGQAQSLPFPDSSVDFVVSSLSLHHWSEPDKALLEIHRILKPGGQMLIFDARRDTRRAFYWATVFARQFLVPGAIKEINEPAGSILASYTPQEVSDMLEASPFHLRSIRSGPAWLFIWARKAW